MEFAEFEFRNARPMEDGAPIGDHLASGARQLAALTGRPVKLPPEVIEGPALPDEVGYLWTWFIELSQGLPVNGWAAPSVSWIDIQAWQMAMDIGRLEPWEAKGLVDLGALRVRVLSEKSEAERRSKPPPRG